MAEVQYSARFELPYAIERGRSNLLQCRVYRAGALAAPGSGTITIYDDAGTVVVNAAAVTITASVAEYMVTSSVLSAKSYSLGWRIEWSLAMPDGVTHVFRNEAALVRTVLAPMITEADIYRRHRSLDPSVAGVIHSQTDFAQQLDEAWTELSDRLWKAGHRPNLVVSPSALRQPLLLLSLAIIFESFSTRLNAAYRDQAVDYRAQYNAAWNDVTLRFVDDDSNSSAGDHRSAAEPTLWLC